MGYIAHHAIIVTGNILPDTMPKDTDINRAHAKAIEICGPEIVSDIIKSAWNHYGTFVIAPDGSKEGWESSDKYNSRRSCFLIWLNEQPHCYDWVLLRFGGDEPSLSGILLHNGKEQI